MVDLALSKGDAVVATLRLPEQLDDFKAEYPPNKQLLVLKMDITSEKEVASAFIRAKDVFGRIDIVFNTAGRGYLGEVEGTSNELAREVMEINFISSGVGMVCMPAGAFFVAAKHALEGFSESLNMELDTQCNQVTVIEPGGFRTKAPQGNIVQLPVHPAYERESLPSYQLRKLFDTKPAMGDPKKAATKIYDLAELKEPPMRLALGEDCVQAIKGNLAAVGAELDKYTSWSKNLTINPEKREIFFRHVSERIAWIWSQSWHDTICERITALCSLASLPEAE